MCAGSATNKYSTTIKNKLQQEVTAHSVSCFTHMVIIASKLEQLRNLTVSYLH